MARRPNLDGAYRRALELLASCPEGYAEALMLAQGFTIEQTVELIRAGLATAQTGRIVAGPRTLEIARGCGSPRQGGGRFPSRDLSRENQRCVTTAHAA